LAKNSAYNAEWYAKNKDRVLATHKKWSDKNKNYFRGWHLKRKYGITLEDFERMNLAQSGRCAICMEMELDNGVLRVDHNHSTGKVRQLLCSRCNQSIGLSRENVLILRNMIAYLEKHETPATNS